MSPKFEIPPVLRISLAVLDSSGNVEEFAFVGTSVSSSDESEVGENVETEQVKESTDDAKVDEPVHEEKPVTGSKEEDAKISPIQEDEEKQVVLEDEDSKLEKLFDDFAEGENKEKDVVVNDENPSETLEKKETVELKEETQETPDSLDAQKEKNTELFRDS